MTAASRTPDALGMRSLYLLSQAQRRLGDTAGAEASARKLIAQNSGSAFGYYALAEALEERRQYQAVIDALAPVVAKAPGPAFDVTILLPHLGFAYQELGQYDKSIATFEQARRLSPKDAGRRRLSGRGEYRRQEISAPPSKRRAPPPPTIPTICACCASRPGRCATRASPSRAWRFSKKR